MFLNLFDYSVQSSTPTPETDETTSVVKCVSFFFFLVNLSLTVQNDLCAEFDTGKLFWSHLQKG